jgi:hypothetical protein
MPVDASSYINQERVECSIQAANHYRIPALVLLAVAEQEGGKPGQKVRNRNGTFDYGAMQFNTVSLADLRKFGIHEKHVLAKGCYPYFLAAWRISGHIQSDSGDIWQRAANYHSRTLYFNRIYRVGLLRRAAKITHRLGFANEPSGAIAFQAVSQASPNDHELTPKTNANPITAVATPLYSAYAPYTAYAAPIRVMGFDSLYAFSLQLKQTGAIPDAKLSWSATQSHAVNGW